MHNDRRRGRAGSWLAAAAIVGLASATLGCDQPAGEDTEWVRLFNGQDLTGWETFDIENGFNNDRQRIFSVVVQDGEPAIRITGEVLGGLVTRQFAPCRPNTSRRFSPARPIRSPPSSAHSGGDCFSMARRPPAGADSAARKCLTVGKSATAHWSVGKSLRDAPGASETRNQVDLVTTEAFDEFELQFEWKTSPGGNSGVFFRVSEGVEAVYQLAPELEIRDNAAWTDSRYPAGSNYLLHVPTRDVTKPVGQWNHSSILVEGDHVEHWMNGVKIDEYQLFGRDWLDRLKRSHFGENPGFARTLKGPIALQNIGCEVRFRSHAIIHHGTARDEPVARWAEVGLAFPNR